MSLLEVRGLQVEIGGVPALRGVDLDLERGGRVGLIGESGSGKSLTALAIMGLLPEGATFGGSVRLESRELLGMPEADLCRIRGDRIAMVFQEPMSALNPVMRAGDQVAESLRLHRSLSRREAGERAVDLLRRVRMPDPGRRARSYPHELSGGQRQRVVMAMALACEPDVLIADEPTTALDVTVQAQVLEVLAELVAVSNLALLLITHDLAVVSEMCDTVSVLYGGRVVEEGPTAGVFSRPRHPYTAGLLGSVPDLDAPAGTRRRLDAIAGTVPALGGFPSGCSFRDRCPRADLRCTEVPPLGGEPHRAACWFPLDG